MKVLTLTCLVTMCAAGCAGGDGAVTNVAPVIDRLVLDEKPVLGIDGYYQLEGWVSAHDPDGVIETLVIRPRTGGERSFAMGPTPSVTDFPLVVRWAHKSDAVGPYEFNLTVRDDELLESVTETLRAGM